MTPDRPQGWLAPLDSLPRPPTTGVCRGCCMDPDIEADFLDHDAADLPLAHVRDWYDAAYAEDLGYAQMGWLIPRVADLLLQGEEVAAAGPEVVLTRLPPSGFPDRWPQAAVEAVKRCCHLILDHKIAEGTAHLDVWLCMIAGSGLPLGPFLADLDGLDDETLAHLLHRNWVISWAGTIPYSGFWPTEAGMAYWAWATGAALEDRMTRAGLDDNDEAAAVSDIIARTRRRP